MTREAAAARPRILRFFDLHVHSEASHDCAMEPSRIRAAAISRGLSGVAIADHGRLTLPEARLSDSLFSFIPAEEVKTTDRGDVIGLFLKKEIARGPLCEVSAKIRSQGGLVLVPHPFDSAGRDAVKPQTGEADLFDAVEIFNARCLGGGANRKALLYASEAGLPVTGGSDAHTYGEIGNAATIAQIPESLPAQKALAALRSAILSKKTSAVQVRQAPILTRLSTSVIKVRKILSAKPAR